MYSSHPRKEKPLMSKKKNEKRGNKLTTPSEQKKTKRIRWNDELCRQEAMKYEYLKDFMKNSKSAYQYARKTKLLESFAWLKRLIRTDRTKEECFEIANQYSTLAEFIKNQRNVYEVMRRRGWDKELDLKRRKLLTKDVIADLASKYSTLSDFCRENLSAYDVARRNGWADVLSHLKKNVNVDPSEKIWLVYVYELVNKTAYVGLTRVFKTRDAQHKGNYEGKDPIYKFCSENSAVIPEAIILKKGLDAEEAQFWEDWYRNDYEKKGWSILNKAKTGIGSSSLGGGITKWTREACYEAAKECTSAVELNKKYQSAYFRANKEGWVKDYTWFVDKIHRPVVVYNHRGELLKEYDMKKSVRDDVRESSATIDRCLRENRPTHYGLLIKYRENVLDEEGNVLLHIDPPKEFSDYVIKYDLEGNFIERFDSIGDAEDSISVNQTFSTPPGIYIYKSLMGKSKTALGFIWKWDKDVLDSKGNIKQKIDVS